MARAYILALLFLPSFAAAARAEEYRAILMWVDVKGRKLDLIIVPKGKEATPQDRIDALHDGKESTWSVSDQVKVYVPRDKKPNSKDLVEDPTGLAAIRLPGRVIRHSTPGISYVDVTVDAKQQVTVIKLAGKFWIETRMKRD
jgi:hypothetical protein